MMTLQAKVDTVEEWGRSKLVGLADWFDSLTGKSFGCWTYFARFQILISLVALFAFVCVVDICLVVSGHQSISLTTWLFESANVIVIVPAMGLTLFIGWLVRSYWWAVYLVALIAYHMCLFPLTYGTIINGVP